MICAKTCASDLAAEDLVGRLWQNSPRGTCGMGLAFMVDMFPLILCGDHWGPDGFAKTYDYVYVDSPRNLFSETLVIGSSSFSYAPKSPPRDLHRVLPSLDYFGSFVENWLPNLSQRWTALLTF